MAHLTMFVHILEIVTDVVAAFSFTEQPFSHVMIDEFMSQHLFKVALNSMGAVEANESPGILMRFHVSSKLISVNGIIMSLNQNFKPILTHTFSNCPLQSLWKHR